MNITGLYGFEFIFTRMFKQYRFTTKGHNLITSVGESYFLNRWKDNKFEPIKQIVLGEGSTTPTKEDEKLNKYKLTLNPSFSVDVREMSLTMTANIEPAKLLNVCEIGVINNDGKLISHDVFNPFTRDVLSASSNVQLEYKYLLESGTSVSQWTPYQRNIYYTTVSGTVKGVFDDEGNGYIKKEDIADLTTDFTYYYSSFNHRVYIYRSVNPTNQRITIKE